MVAEGGAEVVPGDARGDAEAGDRLGRGREGIVALQVHDERPGGDEEVGAALAGAAVHLTGGGPGAPPAPAVGGAGHGEGPAGGVGRGGARLQPGAYGTREPRVE